MATSIKKDGPTPNGGVRSEMFFFNDENELVEQDVATKATIQEYDAKGSVIHTTYGDLKKPE